MRPVSEAAGLAILIAGLGALAATGGLLACCLRLRSPVAFLLAAYLIAWGWLVTVTLLLSPPRWVTRGSLLAALALGLAAAVATWNWRGRPGPPSARRSLSALRDAFRDPAILVLGVTVSLGTLYIGALAFFTPSNDWDALAYHLARASLWHQRHGLGHIDDVADFRVNYFPPNAEIGQLATMLLAGNDRYTTLPQLLAYPALVLSVAGLARRIGLTAREATFAALAFATLPVVALQAPTALNDLVVASFLSAAAYFALGPGRASLLPFGVAIALAVGSKYSTFLALPVLALVVAVAQPRRRWGAFALAGLAGCVAGAVWYVVNVVETGRPLLGAANQRAESSPEQITVTALRYILSFLDMPGGEWPYSLAYLVPVAALAVAGVVLVWRSASRARGLLWAAALTAAVVAAPLLWESAVRGPYKLGLVLGGRDLVDRFDWGLNVDAEPTVAWFGPLAPVLLAAGAAAALVAWRRGRLPVSALVLAAAPWILLLTLALALVWDPWRGRFLLFGIVLAAATWGLLLRRPTLAYAGAAIGSTALFLALANYDEKPSGIFAGPSIWGDARWQAQTRNSEPEAGVLRFVEERVPDDARLGVSHTADHWIHPFFGPRLTRHVTLVRADGGSAPPDANWLVLAPLTRVRRCPAAWRLEFEHPHGWRIERRIGRDACLPEAAVDS
jgi:hypothetical protein